MTLLTRAQAELFIRRCERNRIRILAIEAVTLAGEAIVPGPTADYTLGGRVSPPQRSARDARRFVRTVAPGSVFEFVTEGPGA